MPERNDDWVLKHDARVRTCIVLGVPREHLRDDIRCAACDELHRLQHLDPDVLEVLGREDWCDACNAGDKPVHTHRAGYPCPVGGYVRPRQFWLGPNDKILTDAEELRVCVGMASEPTEQ